jgi:hypothetical protein
MSPTKNFDKILKELGDLYEFNREIQKFSFTSYEEQPTPANMVSEGTMKYDVRNTK